jgi:hypothetical protein
MNTQSKYLTPLLTIGVIVGAAFQSAIVGGVTLVEALQLAGLLVGAVVTYVVPVLDKGWAAGAKVGGAVLGAILAAAIPVFDGLNGGPGLNAETAVIILFAGLSALAAQFGVDQRVDAVKEALASPNVSNEAPKAVDPKATQFAIQSETVNVIDNHDGRTGI